MFNAKLILPSSACVAAINPSLRLVGARIDGPPPTPSGWQVTIYYSTNQSMINGTTTIGQIVGRDGLAIIESPAPAGVNSSEVAHNIMRPPLITMCRTYSSNNSSSRSSSVACETSTGEAYAGSYITTMSGLSVIVNQYGNAISWTDDRRLMNVGIEGGSTISLGQVLGLASTMI